MQEERWLNPPLFLFGIICEFPESKQWVMKEQFDRIIKAVADAADLTCAQILSKRRFPDSLDARWIAVKLLRDEGFYSSKIAELMSMTTRNVNHIIYAVEIRLSHDDKPLKQLLETSKKQLRNIREISS